MWQLDQIMSQERNHSQYFCFKRAHGTYFSKINSVTYCTFWQIYYIMYILHTVSMQYCRNSKRTIIVCHSDRFHTKVVQNAFRHVIMFRSADLSPSLFLSISTCHTEWSCHSIYQECYMAWGNTGQLC